MNRNGNPTRNRPRKKAKKSDALGHGGTLHAIGWEYPVGEAMIRSLFGFGPHGQTAPRVPDRNQPGTRGRISSDIIGF
jgi:hypothetical protein